MAGIRDPVAELVDGFARNVASSRAAQVNEARIRLEYIDPFWRALGWDVANQNQLGPDDKEVVVEPVVGTVEGQRLRSRRPDYIFRIGRAPRFVVEAKDASLDLGSDRDAIFQAKTYAWSAQIPFAILTNFGAFRVFDCTLRPVLEEPERGLVRDFDLAFTDYETQWDVLHRVFGRRAVADGALDGLLARLKRVRAGRKLRGVDRTLIELHGSEPVDKAFLQLLENFRKRFARDLYSENRPVFRDANTRHGAAELTEAVQRILDRIVFIRVCEDRGIVPWGGLQDTLNHVIEEGGELYSALITRFREFDQLFNGYLFKPHPLSEQLVVLGELLADLIRSLYLPEGPYRFDAIGDDILGTIYERFLGSVVVIRSGRAQVEEKPEVRHAGGVYYTPGFIVDTIVRRAITPFLEGLSPLEVLGIRVVDPACGSGSFLVAAFEALVKQCEAALSLDPALARWGAAPRHDKGVLASQKDDRWQLTDEFKSLLLTSCIFGLDIDRQAVEVTVLSLYLKLLESDTEDAQGTRMAQLPPLDNNVRCGNALIDPEEFDRYWEQQFGGLFGGDEDLKFRLNMFDWKSETRGFGRVFTDHGGFTCVIGNPPYIRIQELRKWADEEAEFYRHRYRSAARGAADIYVAFAERGLALLRPRGVLSYIMPHKFWQAEYGAALRGIVAGEHRVKSIVDFGDQQVFREVNTYTAVHVIESGPGIVPLDFARVLRLHDGDAQCREIDAGITSPEVERFEAQQPRGEEQWHFHPAHVDAFVRGLSDRGVALSPSIARQIFQGVITGADDVFLSEGWREHPTDGDLVIFNSAALGRPVELERNAVVPVVRREGFGAYRAGRSELLILPYDRETEALLGRDYLADEMPRTWQYLGGLRGKLEGREEGRFKKEWWCLSRPQNIRRWCRAKVMVPYMVDRLQAIYDEQGRFFVNVTTGGYGLELVEQPIEDWPLVVVGLLNSRLMDYWLRKRSNHFQGGYFPANKQFIESMPMWMPRSAEDKQLARVIVEAVKSITKSLSEIEAGIAAEGANERRSREVEARQKRLDAAVMEAYGVEELPSGA